MNQPPNTLTPPQLSAAAIHLHRHWLAMATRFDLELVGADAEHLEAVAAAIEDEVHRLDGLLSRYHPASEISRLNRRAAAEPLRVDADVWQLLVAAEHFRQATDGFFDVTASSVKSNATENSTPRFLLDAAQRTIRFSHAQVAIDLGAIGKGFALDRAKQLLAHYGVDAALLSAGSSSILALGRPTADSVWTADIRHPTDDSAPPIGRVQLVERSLSCSAAVRPDQAESDIVDPHTALPLAGGDAVVVLAPSGACAEVLSTALLAMGRRRATEFANRLGEGDSPILLPGHRKIGTVPPGSPVGDSSTKVEVAWIAGPSLDSQTECPNLAWLNRSHD